MNARLNLSSATCPEFLLIGAPRCASTFLYEAVQKHPDVFMSDIKEPWFFSFGHRDKPFAGPRDESMHHCEFSTYEEYCTLFDPAEDGQIRGEGSTIYLYSEEALEAIADTIPKVKMVATLRNPIDRGFSNWMQHLKQGLEFLETYEEALEAEDQRIAEDWAPYWFYRSVGFYGKQIQRYQEKFGAESLHVVLYEDLIANPKETIGGVHAFLGLDPIEDNAERETREAVNVGAMPKMTFARRFMTQPSALREYGKHLIPPFVRTIIREKIVLPKKLRAGQMIEAPKLSPELRAELAEVYRDDVALLREVTGLDLSQWEEFADASELAQAASA